MPMRKGKLFNYCTGVLFLNSKIKKLTTDSPKYCSLLGQLM